nr:GTP-binding protein [Chroococcidiopsis sp. CCMEE 29]
MFYSTRTSKGASSHSQPLENDGFISISFQSDRPFNVYKFQNFLTEQMSENVFRAKGIFWFSESNSRHILTER